jgi:hypothetical protein
MDYLTTHSGGAMSSFSAPTGFVSQFKKKRFLKALVGPRIKRVLMLSQGRSHFREVHDLASHFSSLNVLILKGLKQLHLSLEICLELLALLPRLGVVRRVKSSKRSTKRALAM